MIAKTFSRSTAVWTAAAMFLLQLCRIAWIVHRPVGLMVQGIPDDAFYYLVLARNFAAHGRWTFDGVSPSSGFHLLWGYLLAAFAFVAPRLSFPVVFVCCSVFAATLLSVAAGCMVAICESLFGAGAVWGVVAVLFSAISMTEATWLMEAPLVLFFGTLCLFLLVKHGENRAVWVMPAAFALGLLGSLSRSDFGLLPFWLAVACVLARMVGDGSGRRLFVAGLQLAGAAAGVAVVLVHCYWVSHEWAQASAQVKLGWAKYDPVKWSAIPIAENLLNPLFNYHSDLVQPQPVDLRGYDIRQWVMVVVLCGALYCAWRLRRSFAPVLLLTMTCAGASYVLLYHFDGGVQDWYAVNFTVPLCVLAAAAWSLLPGRWRSVGAVVAVVFAAMGTVLSVRPMATWQEATYRSGLALRNHPEWRPLGTWNAGVMSYFGGGNVVNLDGLVNDDLLPYIKKGTLADYIDQRSISYVIESPNILTSVLAQRSGIGDGRLARCVVSRTVLFPDDPYDNAYDMHLTLMHIDRDCLRHK